MRAPLTPLKAFVHDAANLGRAGTNTASDDPRLTQWLAVAQAAERLANLAPAQRSEYAATLATRVLPDRDERPTQIEGDGRIPTDALGRLGERLRLEAEDMERAGCFELARTTVASVCQMLAHAPLTGRLLATAHLGRVNRQIGDLPAAVDCYSTVTEQGKAANDGPLAAHGFIGLGNVAHHRGNRPAQKSFFEQALGLAAKGGPVELSARQGLAITAYQEGHLADALLHGWRAHDLAPPNSIVQFEVLVNLADTALYAGFFTAALAGYEFVIQRCTVTRVLVPTIYSGLRAASRTGNRAQVDSLEALGKAEINKSSAKHDEASFYFWAAEARHNLGDYERARELVNQCLQIANKHEFHELRVRGELLLDAKPGTPATKPEGPVFNFDAANPVVQVGIGRLTALSGV